MTVSYNLAPIPKWVMINNAGTTAGGAKLYTKSSLNKTMNKPVYKDAGGTIPWTNPIIFDANGTQGPFYWKTDTAQPDDTYYLEAYDSNNTLLWTLDDYFPSGSGGGGNVTTYISLNNMIPNNVFLNHIDDTANPTNTTNLVIAPSNHVGFTPSLINPVVGTYGVVGEDIRFVKNNTLADDQILFEDFPLGLDPLTGDATPDQYLRYQCTNTPTGETYKCFQFPINQKVNTLDNQAVTFTLWARVNATSTNVALYTRQYFGTGGSPSAEVRTLQGNMALTTSWTKFFIQYTVANTSGKTLGTCGDDATYLQLEMPLNIPCDVWFTKPCLYNGTINPDLQFQTNDEIDSVIMSPRTGEEMMTFRSSAPQGWIAADDGSIGNTGSGATTRANTDTFFLYKTLWDSVVDMYAPVSSGRGSTAVDDFVAGKTLTLPLSLGRLRGAAGLGAGLTNRDDGEFLGTETISIADMPSHHHGTIGVIENYAAGGAASTYNTTGGINTTNTTATGGSGADGKMPPSSFRYVYIKL